MNVKLTESDYQHMIMELLSQSMVYIENIRQSGDEDMVDWVYFLERLKLKGVLNDLRLVKSRTSPKAITAARMLRLQFGDDNSEKNITTII